MKKNKCRLLERHKVSEDEKKRYEEIYAKEKDKFARDSLAGGVSENGHYIRLHDRCY